MDPLATADDLSALLSVTLDGDALSRAALLLAAASSRVRGYTGQDFTEATTTDRLKVRNGRCTLPQRPVTDVASVADLNAQTVTYELVGDTLWLNPCVPDPWSWEPRTTPLSYVDVEYTHGYAIIPDDVVFVVLQVAARAFGVNAADSGLTSETVSGYSYQVGSAAAAGALGLLPQERETLDRYRRVGSMGWLAVQ